MFALSIALLIGFILIHLYSKNMKFLTVLPRSRFLSIAGGISVAYVFLHLLPELAGYEEEMRGEGGWEILKHPVYFFAMLGLIAFYGLEQLVKISKRRHRSDRETRPRDGVFWVHVGSFALYNALIGYLLVTEEFEGVWGMLLYFIAMGVHFITNDKGLRATHAEEYDKRGRWLLAASILIGWLVGVITELPVAAVALFTALIVGGVVLNVMKEELPEDRESRFSAFCLGVAGYSALLLLL